MTIQGKFSVLLKKLKKLTDLALINEKVKYIVIYFQN